MEGFVSSFSGFSVNDIAAAHTFYINTLGLTLQDENMGLHIVLPGGQTVFIYEKPDHQPASFTILNFVVTNIDAVVDELKTRGVRFERYDLGNGAAQDENDILRGLSAGMGPDIAWFKDPAGNVLSVLQSE